MAGHKAPYPYSLAEAKRFGEVDEWRESYKLNCDCARAIERAIAEAHDYENHHLNDATAHIIEAYGFDRVNFVLANTIQEKDFDGRFSERNKNWAKGHFIPSDENRWHYVVDSHPLLTNAFVDQMRDAWNRLGLFEARHCSGEDNFLGHIVIIRPNALKDEFKTPEDQLFYANGGNGCNPKSLGTKVFGFHLNDGEKTNYQRADILGVIAEEHIPEWAKENLEKFLHDGEDEACSTNITMGGI